MLVDGTIHSPSEPHAEAMFVQDGVIAWIGSPETAGRLADSQHIRQELDRALVTPAFVGRMERALDEVTAEEVTAALDGVAGLGWGVLRLVLSLPVTELLEKPHQTRSHLIEALEAAVWHPLVVYPAVRLTGFDAGQHGGAGGPGTLVSEAMRMLSGVDDTAGSPVSMELDLAELGGTTRQERTDRLAGVSAAVARGSRQLLLDVTQVPPQDVTATVTAVRRQLRERSATPRPDLPTVLVGFDSAVPEDWEALIGSATHVMLLAPGNLGCALSVGIPTSVAPPETASPWRLVAAHAHHPEKAVSVRAAFNAQTRGAHRSLPGTGPGGAGLVGAGLGGQLDHGAPATFAVWEVESLAVQAPDSRTAAWSTDIRARTPLLPYIEQDHESGRLPQLRATVVGGVEVHGTADAPGSRRAQ